MATEQPDIRKNLDNINSRIRSAAEKAGRQHDEIRLIAVSKCMPPAYIEAAMAAGQRCFGENTIKDAQQKQELMNIPGSEWHFIGHLQSKKAKHIPGNFSWLHTLDSVKLADKLSDRASQAGQHVNVLVQVNIAADPDKYGLSKADLDAFIEALLGKDHPGLSLKGLMTIGRRDQAADERRREFSDLRELACSCAERFGQEYFTELSMGMSGDFETAIEEGATMIRVGSSIFGPRPDRQD